MSRAPLMPKCWRALWIGVQVVCIHAFLLSAVVTMEMSFAETGKGYMSASGTPVQCEALSPRAKGRSERRCAWFGSMKTNPMGYGLALTCLMTFGGVLWISSRTGLGLRARR